jgi:hypothetical protein
MMMQQLHLMMMQQQLHPMKQLVGPVIKLT